LDLLSDAGDGLVAALEDVHEGEERVGHVGVVVGGDGHAGLAQSPRVGAALVSQRVVLRRYDDRGRQAREVVRAQR
jgi:hypothetical protein